MIKYLLLPSSLSRSLSLFSSHSFSFHYSSPFFTHSLHYAPSPSASSSLFQFYFNSLFSSLNSTYLSLNILTPVVLCMFSVRYFLSLPHFFSPSDSTIKLPQLIPIHAVLHRTTPPELPHSKTLQYFNNTTHAHPSLLLDLCTSIQFKFIFYSQINQAYICLYVVPIFFELHVKFQLYSVFSFFCSARW